MANQLVVAVPPAILDLVQSGALERAFHDGLFPKLAYRAEALKEEWPANSGTEMVMSRPGLLPTISTPNVPGVDPTPQQVPYEQWIATLAQWSGATDINMPSSNVANANLFMRSIHQLGLQAGRSVNFLARDAMFKAYLSGNTVANVGIAAIDTTIHVSSLNGFTDLVNPALSARPQPVSASNPLLITIGTAPTSVQANVILATPDNLADPFGPGTLTLSSAIGTPFAGPRTPVVSKYAARVVRAAGGNSIDAITASDTLTLQQIINAVGFLRDFNVQPHEDGFFHAHISSMSNTQLFADPVFQRLNQSLPDHVIYREGFIGHMSGVIFYMNTESPNLSNGGTLVATGTGVGAGQLGQYAPQIGAEVVNGNGVTIGRVLITGKGGLYERYMDESAYVSEAGLNGKVGEFDVVNNGIAISSENIRLILRAPVDRLQQMVGAAWSISTSFATPSDVTAPGGFQRYKRCIVLEHAL